MGTITDKLNWLFGKKDEFVNIINGKYTARGYSTQFTNLSNFNDITSRFTTNFTHRMRLIPILTMYTQYNCVSTTTYGYYGKSNFNDTHRAEPWLDQILSPYSIYTLDGEVPPVLTRQGTGVLTADGFIVHPNAVHNIPFAIGCGTINQDTNKFAWLSGNPIYCSIPYFQPDFSGGSGKLKILLADDAINNDGHFIFGNISLIDPLSASPQIYEHAMFCITYNYFNTVYSQSGINFTGIWYFQGVEYTYSYDEINPGHYYVTYNGIGYNVFSKFSVIPISTLSNESGYNYNGKNYISLKNITVTYDQVYVEITTSDDESLNRAPFGLMLFAKKYNV